MLKKRLTGILVLAVLMTALLGALAVFEAGSEPENASDKVYLSDIKWKSYKMEANYKPWLDDDSCGDGKINLSNVKSFEKGVRTHPGDTYPAFILYDISDLNAFRFRTYVGPDKNGTTGVIQFVVYLDGKEAYTSAKLSYGMYEYIDLDVTGVKTLKIEENDGGDGYSWDGGCWADAHFLCCSSEGSIGMADPGTNSLLTSSVTFRGNANADSVVLYAGETKIGEGKVEKGAWSVSGTVPSSVPKNSELKIRAVSVVDGKESKTASVTMLYLPEYGALTDLTSGMSGDMTVLSPAEGAILAGAPLNEGVSLPKGKSFEASLGGAEYLLYEGIVGLDSAKTNTGSIVLKVSADGKEIYASPVLTGTDTALLRLEIPKGTKKLTFTSEVEKGYGTLLLSNGTFFQTVGSKDALTKKLLSSASETVLLGDTMLHARVPEARGLVLHLGSEKIEGSFDLRVFPYKRGYVRSTQEAAVMHASGCYDLGGGNWYVPFPSLLPEGEYVFVFGTSKDVKIGASKSGDCAICVGGKASQGAIDASFVLSSTSAQYGKVTKGPDDTKAGNFATESEKKAAEKNYRGWLSDLSTFPASFKIGSKAYTGFGSDFKKISQDVTTDPQNKAIEHTVTVLSHTETKLQFTIFSEYYPDYAAYEWVIYIENKGSETSPKITELYGADMKFKGADPVVNGNIGDSAQYRPDIRPVTDTEIFTPVNGRSTQGANPYFNFEYGNGGALIAIGWSGKWEAAFRYTASGSTTRFTARQETFSATLKKGETARTPLVAIVNYEGCSLDRAANLWRHWFLECSMHKVISEETGEFELFSPAIAAASSVQFHEMTKATDAGIIESIRQYIANDIDISFCWMDAGWYFDTDGKTLADWGWTATGSWQIDTKRFPSKLFDISQYGKSVGVKTLLWFEPERFSGTAKTNGYTVNPKNILSGYLVNEGDKDTRDWILNRILTTMNDGNITLYREDFNCDPLSAWREHDSVNRKGMTENLYVQGHLYIWDEILKARPSSMIDSCASGGNRNDLEAIKRAVPLHKTDYNYGDSAAQQCIALMMYEWMPYFGTKADNNDVTYSDRYFLRTALVPFMVLNYDFTSRIDWDIVRDVVDEKNALDRYLYKDYYRLTEYSRSESAPMAWEFYDPEDKSGYAMVFRRPEAPAETRLYLKGLDPETTYHVWFEDAGKHTEMTGRELMNVGIGAVIPAQRSSDILHFSTVYDRGDLEASITCVSANGKYLEAISSDAKAKTYQFDIRFDRSLRANVLSSGKKLETGVTNAYYSSILINGMTVKQMNEEKKDSVKLNYDPINNILQVVVAQINPAKFKPNEDNTVVLKSTLTTASGDKLGKDVTFTYSKSSKSWSKTDVPVIHVQLIAPQGVVNVGSKLLLTAVVTPFDATVGGADFTVSDESVATVDAKGYLSGKKEGKVTVTASAKDGSGLSASLEIEVLPKKSARPDDVKVISTDPYEAPAPETEPIPVGTETEEEKPGKKGCFGSVGAAVLLPLLAGAVLTIKKKR